MFNNKKERWKKVVFIGLQEQSMKVASTSMFKL